MMLSLFIFAVHRLAHYIMGILWGYYGDSMGAYFHLKAK